MSYATITTEQDGESKDAELTSFYVVMAVLGMVIALAAYYA